MVPSCISPPEGYRPVYQEVARGIYEVVNAYEGTYGYFNRPDPNGHPANELRSPVVRRRPATPGANEMSHGADEGGP